MEPDRQEQNKKEKAVPGQTKRGQILTDVRRNLLMLSKNERKQYFWCLKMLGILPPFEKMRERQFKPLQVPIIPYNQDGKYIKPTCLHDQLIANHSTCCQHNSFFFAHYHRHLMFLFELRLNYADQVLRLSVQKFKQKFPQLYQRGYNEELRVNYWDHVLKQYQTQIAPVQRKVMAHYWNPTNYNCRDDLVIPEEISNPLYFPRQPKIDPVTKQPKIEYMDQLFRIVNGVYCYEINPLTRWSTNKKVVGQYLEQPYYNHKYQEDIQDILAGKQNPRNTLDISKFMHNYTRYITTSPTSAITQKIYQQIGYKFQKTGRVDLLNLKEDQILLRYGGRFSKDYKNKLDFHYFDEKDLRHDVEKNTHRVTYNQLQPHYQLAYALFNKKFTDLPFFFDHSSRLNIQNSHNVMHNNMGFCLNHPLYSVTNLLFYPYHSWIDLELEMKLRLNNNRCQANRLKKFMENNLYDGRSQKSTKPKLSQFRIKQWIGPQNNRIEPVHGFHYMLSGKNFDNIRTSLQLQDYYWTQYLNQPSNKEIYQSFEGYEKYNANYDYQVYQVEIIEGTTQQPVIERSYMLGDGKDTRIPKYLSDMKEQVNFYENGMEQKIVEITKTLTINEKYTTKFYRKLLDKRFLLMVKYPSSIPNGTYLFKFKMLCLYNLLTRKDYQYYLPQYQQDLLQKENEKMMPEYQRNRRLARRQEIAKKLQEPRELFVINHFGKEQKTNQCPSCKDFTYQLVNISDEISNRINVKETQAQKQLSLKHLWNAYNILLLDCRTPNLLQDNQDDTSLNLKQFILNPQIPNKEQEFYIKLVEGAEDLSIDFNLSSNVNVWGFQAYITADAHRILGSDEQITLQKKLDQDDFIQKDPLNFSTSFDFMDIVNKDILRQSSGLKKIIYSNVKASIYVNGVRKEFEFQIKNYHEKVRYRIEATFRYANLRVEVYDKDLEFKLKFHEQNLSQLVKKRT